MSKSRRHGIHRIRPVPLSVQISMADQGLVRRISFVLCLVLLGAIASPSQADQAIESLDAIRQAAERYVASQLPSSADVSVIAGKLDKRLRLPACGYPLIASVPYGGDIRAQTTVSVQCEGDRPWRLFVPVRVSEFGHVFVAARPLAVGTVVEPGDLTRIRRDLNAIPHGYIRSEQAILGRTVTRAVAKGTPLTANALASTVVIHRGQRVRIMARYGSALIRMGGEAITEGAIGDYIKVKNQSSGRVIEGVVRSESEVEVQM